MPDSTLEELRWAFNVSLKIRKKLNHWFKNALVQQIKRKHNKQSILEKEISKSDPWQ